jgi:phage host-nuclease inhibitor protein Gam
MAVVDHDVAVDFCLTDCDHDSCERQRELAEDGIEHFLTVAEEGPEVHALLAERMLRAVARRRRRIAHAEAVAAAEIERIQAWLNVQRAKHNTDWLESQLAAYHEARLAEDAKAKTIELPSGTLKARKQPDRFVPDDRELVLSWASDARPELIRTKLELDLPAVKRHLVGLEDTGDVIDPAIGEVVPGIHFEPGEVRFAVEVNL